MLSIHDYANTYFHDILYKFWIHLSNQHNQYRIVSSCHLYKMFLLSIVGTIRLLKSNYCDKMCNQKLNSHNQHKDICNISSFMKSLEKCTLLLCIHSIKRRILQYNSDIYLEINFSKFCKENYKIFLESSLYQSSTIQTHLDFLLLQ